MATLDSFANELAAAARPVHGRRVMRIMATHTLFEHRGLVGGFRLVAWLDLLDQQT